MVFDTQTYLKIKVLSNKYRFEIYQLVSKKEMNVTQISKEIKLSYDKTREYINKLVDVGLVEKISNGREIYIKSKSQVYFEKTSN